MSEAQANNTTDDWPDEGDFLEVWLDIPEVGEPLVKFWQSPGGAQAQFDAWHEHQTTEMEAEVLAVAKPFDERDEWLVHATDPGVGGHSMWVRFRLQ